ncbi:hypothetical protein [Bacillus thermotolerans]|uniref:Uncharacterized protein n=1 Tax=Bacillus thermotolerans TaxID=1221996 RepID=A0A0F5HR17_BACTR|nr:hypothetical protein [Bacillus thermotolerans]KKB35804.1 hypothetical protein QY95_03294 [Bacillus thermotolerans]
MMNLFNCLLSEKCPYCRKTLETSKSNIRKGIVIKACPDQHFQKEFHPALETYIENRKTS